VKRLVLRRPACEEQLDAAAGAAERRAPLGRGVGGRLEEVAEREAEGADGPEPQEITPVEPFAEPSGGTFDGQHGVGPQWWEETDVEGNPAPQPGQASTRRERRRRRHVRPRRWLLQ